MRRTGIRTNQGTDAAEVHTNTFPYQKGDPIVCHNHSTGERINGKYSRMTKDESKIAVVVNNRERWIVLSDFVLERDV